MGDHEGQQQTHDQGEPVEFDDEGHSSEGTILDEGGVDTDERAGRSQGIDTESEPDEETKQEMDEERQRRLDPENRPDNAEVDNTPRDFDVDHGKFTDRDDFDASEPGPYAEDDQAEAAEDGTAEDEAAGDEDEPGPDARR